LIDRRHAKIAHQLAAFCSEALNSEYILACNSAAARHSDTPVQAHWGQIGLESHLGEGSTFYVTLPLYDGDDMGEMTFTVA